MQNWRNDDLTAWVIGWAVLHALRGNSAKTRRLLAALDPQIVRDMLDMLARIPGVPPDRPDMGRADAPDDDAG